MSVEYDYRIDKIKELTERLNKYRDAYYNDSESLVSDAVYDDLYDELESLEKECDFYFCNSPTHSVGYVVNDNLPKIHHNIPLLSLDKTKSFEVAQNFTHGKPSVIMLKLDGLTTKVVYENGELVEASTRGDGFDGQLITDNAKTFSNLPKNIKYKDRLVITGESLILFKDFESINKHLPKERRYKTPRNLASGSVQLLDSSICAKRKVRFYAFNILEGYDCTSFVRKLEMLQNIGFDVVPYVYDGFPLSTDIRAFKRKVDIVLDEAEIKTIPYDGVVIKYNDVVYGESLGRTDHAFKDGIALKFKEEEEQSVITNIEWQVGRTGKITPVAVFDPVILDGTTVTNASLHNISIMEKLGIKPYSDITVIKANEIIPQIIRASGGTSYDFEIPKVCPICGKPTEIIVGENGTKTLYCTNEDCDAKIVRILTHFVNRDGMNIDGLSINILQVLSDIGIVNNVFDIYDIKNHKDEIVALEGFGKKSFNKLVASIEKSRDVKLENFIAALGIPNIALNSARIIAKKFGTWDAFEDALKSGFDFATIDSFGKKTDEGIKKWYNEKFIKNSYFSSLVGHMRFIYEKQEEVDDKLNGLTFVITGDVHHFANRKELQNKIESLGGKCSGSVSSKTNYLINNDNTSPSSKNKKAKSLNIPIITEEEFIEMIK